MFGADRSTAQGSGAITLNFEQARKIAGEKRKEQFELNKKRFFGEDGWDGDQYKGNTNAFWGC